MEIYYFFKNGFVILRHSRWVVDNIKDFPKTDRIGFASVWPKPIQK